MPDDPGVPAIPHSNLFGSTAFLLIVRHLNGDRSVLGHTRTTRLTTKNRKLAIKVETMGIL